MAGDLARSDSEIITAKTHDLTAERKRSPSLPALLGWPGQASLRRMLNVNDRVGRMGKVGLRDPTNAEQPDCPGRAESEPRAM